LLALGVFSSPLLGQQGDPFDDDILSPSVLSLRTVLTAGSKNALGEFWANVEGRGTPLLEQVPNDTLHLFVTFLWRSEEPLSAVLLYSGLTNWNRTRLTRPPNTDVWYHTFRVRRDARFTYSMAELRDPNEEVSWRLDPLNPAIIDWPEDESLVELPHARPQPWITPGHGVRSGRLTEHRLSSAILQNERTIWVYTPAGYSNSGAEYPIVVFFDGKTYLEYTPTPTILDNLIGEELIPPTIAVFVEHPTPEARIRELGCNSRFDDFLLTELLPWVRQRYRVTRDPTQTVAAGLSRGGLAAACLALRHPEVFGNVLSQSGAFWYKPPWERGQQEIWHFDIDSVGYGWLMGQYAAVPMQPICFYLDVGRFEKDDEPPLWHANVHMRDVLVAKGYSVVFQEFSGGHSSINWRGTVSDGLIALLGQRRR
jgi:enterochelin esterase family protein